MNDNLIQIQSLAMSIRDKLESFQKKEKRWSKNLRGACATASYILQQELNKLGINSWMVLAIHKDSIFGEHVWLETDHFAIDLTYSQFSPKETIIITCKHNDQYDLFTSNFNSQRIVGVDFFDNWPAHQRPQNCIKRMNHKKKKAITL